MKQQKLKNVEKNLEVTLDWCLSRIFVILDFYTVKTDILVAKTMSTML